MKRLIFLTLSTLCASSFAQLPDYVPSADVIAWYEFDGDWNSATPIPSGTSNGAVFGANRFGVEGLSARFDGAQTVDLEAPLLPFAEQFSIAFWAKTETFDGHREFLHQNPWPNAMYIGTKPSSGEIRIGDDWQNTGVIVPLGEWFHLALIRSDNNAVLYINGEAAATKGSGIQFSSNVQNMILGKQYGGNAEYLVGNLDELGVWGRALNVQEVQSLFAGPPIEEGCLDTAACNYDPEANVDDGSCHFNCQFCLTGTVWNEELGGCIGDGSGDINLDGCVQLNDLLDLLSAYGNCGAEEVPWQCGDPLAYQGYDYATVQIGEQCWLSENLRNELYQNGDSIPANLSDEEWGNTDTGGVGATTVFGEPSFLCEEFSPDGDGCDEAWSLTAYGRLYNWYALNDARGLCPSGWHVPSDEEWTSLTDQFGGLSNSGDELKTASGWYQGGDGSNASGFSALPGGIRNGGNGSFQHAGSKAFFWTATETIDREFTYWQDSVSRQSGKSLKKGMSVRCLKDLEE